jgi:hypothetical protein
MRPILPNVAAGDDTTFAGHVAAPEVLVHAVDTAAELITEATAGPRAPG